jgi:hypothetical protein
MGGDTEIAVQAALSKLGTAYVWGASGPDNFDCSGLVQWAFGKAGYSLSRTTYSQVNDGSPITGAPQRGDIVFPEAGHVVIALGGNQCVHAPETGDVVKISNYWTAPYAVRRVGPNSGTPGATNTDPSFAAGSAFNSTNVGNGLFQSNPLSGLKQTATFFQALTDMDTWVRMGQVIGGAMVVLVGVWYVVDSGVLGSKTSDALKAIPSVAKKAAL